MLFQPQNSRRFSILQLPQCVSDVTSSLAAFIIKKWFPFEVVRSRDANNDPLFLTDKSAAFLLESLFEWLNQMDGALRKSKVWGQQRQLHTSRREVEQWLTDLTPLFPTVKEICSCVSLGISGGSEQTTWNISRGGLYVSENRDLEDFFFFFKSIKLRDVRIDHTSGSGRGPLQFAVAAW